MGKPTICSAAFAVVIMTGAVTVAAQQPDPGQDLEQQLTAQEQNEYRQRLNSASGDQERNAIHSEYQHRVQNRSRLQDGSASQQRGNGAGQGKGGHHTQKGGGAAISGQQSGQAGSMNKRGKSGK